MDGCEPAVVLLAGGGGGRVFFHWWRAAAAWWRAAATCEQMKNENEIKPYSVQHTPPALLRNIPTHTLHNTTNRVAQTNRTEPNPSACIALHRSNMAAIDHGDGLRAGVPSDPTTGELMSTDELPQEQSDEIADDEDDNVLDDYDLAYWNTQPFPKTRPELMKELKLAKKKFPCVPLTGTNKMFAVYVQAGVAWWDLPAADGGGTPSLCHRWRRQQRARRRLLVPTRAHAADRPTL